MTLPWARHLDAAPREDGRIPTMAGRGLCDACEAAGGAGHARCENDACGCMCRRLWERLRAPEDAPAVRTVSHREVGPSSRPGSSRARRKGSVLVERARVVACPDCGGGRLDLGGPHGVHGWRAPDGGMRWVDCIGREVSRAR